MPEHSHIFLGAGHTANERRTWAAISLAGFMMVAEIAGGVLFGSLAVVADGFHMATHALALLIAAVAYSYARRHANDPRFVFGTGKLGDLAGFTSAIVLAIIALIIGYEAAVRLFSPVTIHFDEAILIAAGGLIVNIATAGLLSAGGGDHHGHAHGHGVRHRGGTTRMRMTSLAASTPGGEFCFWRYSRMACRRASGCAARTISNLRQCLAIGPRRSKPNAPAARGRIFASPIAGLFSNRWKKFPSRMHSRPACGSPALITRMFTSSISLNTDMAALRPPPPLDGTTTCARLSCMWRRMRRSRYSRYAGCSSGAFLAGSGWTLSWASLGP